MTCLHGVSNNGDALMMSPTQHKCARASVYVCCIFLTLWLWFLYLPLIYRQVFLFPIPSGASLHRARASNMIYRCAVLCQTLLCRKMTGPDPIAGGYWLAFYATPPPPPLTSPSWSPSSRWAVKRDRGSKKQNIESQSFNLSYWGAIAANNFSFQEYPSTAEQFGLDAFHFTLLFALVRNAFLLQPSQRRATQEQHTTKLLVARCYQWAPTDQLTAPSCIVEEGKSKKTVPRP